MQRIFHPGFIFLLEGMPLRIERHADEPKSHRSGLLQADILSQKICHCPEFLHYATALGVTSVEPAEAGRHQSFLSVGRNGTNPSGN
jgi:hypothetical protein